jgi:hypothetical protein
MKLLGAASLACSSLSHAIQVQVVDAYDRDLAASNPRPHDASLISVDSRFRKLHGDLRPWVEPVSTLAKEAERQQHLIVFRRHGAAKVQVDLVIFIRRVVILRCPSNDDGFIGETFADGGGDQLVPRESIALGRGSFKEFARFGNAHV